MASMSENEEVSATVDTLGQKSDFRFVHRYSASIERFPVLICLLILLITFGLGSITFLLHGFPSPSDPPVGMEPRGTVLSSRVISLHKLRWADREVLSPVPHGVSLPIRKRETTEHRGLIEQGCPYPRSDFAKIVYKSSNDESLFQMKHLKAICESENRLIRSHPSFLSECLKSNESTGCCSSWSLGYTVALMNNKSSCHSIDENDVEMTRNVLAMCARYYLSGELKLSEQNQDTDIPIECTSNSLVYTIFHYLVPKTFVNGLQNIGRNDPAFTLSFSPIDVSCADNECKENIAVIYEDNFRNPIKFTNSVVDIVALDFALKFYLFNKLLISDFRYIAIAILSAILIIWLYTGSLIITVGSVLNMVMTLILTYFVYYVVFRITFFPFLNIASIVLVIGIGADDTFIYVDLWKLSKDKIGHGIDKRLFVLGETTRHAFLTLLVTSLTTSSALYATAVTNTIAGKCFAVFAGSALLANLMYTITWLPGIIVIYDKYFSTQSNSYSLQGNHSRLRVCWQIVIKAYNTLLKVPKTFFCKLLPQMVFSFRFMWLVLFSLIGVAGFVLVFIYPGLALQESGEFRVFKDTQLFENYDQNVKSDLAFVNESLSNFEMTFIWGVLPTVHQDQWDPFEFGILELDKDFVFGDNESQMWLSEFCRGIKNQTFYNRNSAKKANFCFIDSFIIWMNRTCLPSEDNSCCEQGEFPFPKDLFDKCVVQFMVFVCQSYSCYSYTPGVRFDKNNTIRALYLNLQSSIPFTLQFRPVDNFWENLSSWTETQLSKAPSSLQGGWVYSQKGVQITFYDLQSGLGRETAVTIGISLVTATIVLLLVTQNILITIYAMITITFIVSSVVGILVLLGWELNIFEAITFSLAVGLSVDFTIHYGVAFTLAPFEDRKKRTFFAIETLSSPITVAALSTFSAGVVMIPAVVINYSQIGVFLTLVMSSSWLFSTVFFSSLCVTVGPNKSLGQISLKMLRKGPKNTTSSDMPAHGVVNAGF